MERTCFSVVIPCFNRLDLLRQTLRSLAQQSTSDFEVLMVDDCSSLDINEVLSEFLPAFAQRGQSIRLIRLQQNGGPGRARNVGWNNAAGRYVAFLDSDDLWHPDRLRICREMLDQFDSPVLYHSFCEVGTRSVESEVATSSYGCKPANRWRWLLRNHTATSCVIVRRDVDERFDERLRYVEDYDLWLRLIGRYSVLELVGPPLTFLGRPVMGSGGLSAHRWKMRLSECRMYWKYCRSSPLILALPFLVTWVGLKHVRSLVLRRSVSM